MVEVIPGAYLSPDNIGIDAPVQAKLDYGVISNVGDAWVAVDLAQSYSDMVVVATPSYNVSDLPLVSRVRVTAPNQFEVRVQNPGDAAIPANYDLHYMVAEKGIYAGGGAFLEAALIDATTSIPTVAGSAIRSLFSNPTQTRLSLDRSWAMPVPVGALSGRRTVSLEIRQAGCRCTSVAMLRKMLDVTRADEQLAYIVFEAGSYQVGNVVVDADVGSDSIAGIDDAPPYNYSLAANAEAAVLSSAGMDGANGGWPVLHDSTVFPTNQIGLAIDEDQINDSERSHTTEEVAYVGLMAAPDDPLAADPVVTTPRSPAR